VIASGDVDAHFLPRVRLHDHRRHRPDDGARPTLGPAAAGACFFGSFVSDFGDKAVTFALVTSVLHALPRRTAARFPWALRAIGAA